MCPSPLLSAFAGPIDCCHADAESNHTSLTLFVATGDVTHVSGSDLDTFFDAVFEGTVATGTLVLDDIAASGSADVTLTLVPTPGASTTRELGA